MTKTTLGIDLGTNSIGWALLNEKKEQIIATGVRIFPEGVDRDQKGGEISKNQTRREKRGQRRQTARRRSRKHRLLKQLIEVGLLPQQQDDFYPLLTNPYELRKRGLDEQLSLHQFGRVLLHLNQRRGFKSNRKSDKQNQKETSDMLKEISQLESDIHENGCRTLGEYFYKIQNTDSNDKKQNHIRLRSHHTHREMYEKELELLWQAQQKFYPEVLIDDLYDDVRQTMFFQRDMYWDPKTIGLCELENQKRCPRADRMAQRFRLRQEINNLRLLDESTGEVRSLNAEEREKVYEKLSTTRERSFDKIRTDLGFDEHCKFNFENGKRNKLKGLETDAILSGKKYLGKKWFEYSDQRKDEIVYCIIDEKLGDHDFLDKAQNEWGMDKETAENLLGVNLPDHYMNFSRKAIEKLLPALEEGLPLMTDDKKESAMSRAGYLRPDQRPNKIEDFLPKPPDLPNPIVRQALFEFRKLLNAIIREYGKPDKINIELARDVKNPKKVREEISIKIWERTQLRETAKQEIEKLGEKPTRDNIARYLLWEEQGRICVYSGNNISLAQLMKGEIDVDHILPYSRSLDDSLQNKVVCFRKANADKGDQTPYEWLAEMHPTQYEEVQQRIRKLPFGKRQRFTRKNVELDDFVNRQLTDIQYISREVMKYVRCLGSEIVCTKGQNTSDLRHVWGLNTVLNNENLNIKNREDHRHHAVDAIVVALTDRSRLQQLARSRKRTKGQIEFPHPWPNFRNEAEKHINSIIVSHRVQRKIQGALHKETIYGATKKSGEYVYRKLITDSSFTLNMVNLIRDPVIKDLVIERLKKFGYEPGRGKGTIKKEVWKEPLTMLSGTLIKKVRLIKKNKTIQPIRGGNSHVQPGNTHHICLFKKEGKICKMISVPMIEAARRVKDHEPIIQRDPPPDYPDSVFFMSLSNNEIVMLKHKGVEDIYRFDTSASTSQQMHFIHHTYAVKEKTPAVRLSKKPSTLDARKITVDILGRIRNAND